MSISNGNIKYPIGKSIFVVNLPLKLFPATVTNADIGSLKSLHTLFDKDLDHMMVKFEQNCMVQTTRNFELFDKKTKKTKTKNKTKQNKTNKQKTRFFKPFLTKRCHHFGRRFYSRNNCLTKLLISRLPSFSVPKITVVRHV